MLHTIAPASIGQYLQVARVHCGGVGVGKAVRRLAVVEERGVRVLNLEPAQEDEAGVQPGSPAGCDCRLVALRCVAVCMALGRLKPEAV